MRCRCNTPPPPNRTCAKGPGYRCVAFSSSGRRGGLARGARALTSRTGLSTGTRAEESNAAAGEHQKQGREGAAAGLGKRSRKRRPSSAFPRSFSSNVLDDGVAWRQREHSCCGRAGSVGSGRRTPASSSAFLTQQRHALHCLARQGGHDGRCAAGAVPRRSAIWLCRRLDDDDHVRVMVQQLSARVRSGNRLSHSRRSTPQRCNTPTGNRRTRSLKRSKNM